MARSYSDSNPLPIIEGDALASHYDAVIIGSGAGGGTIGFKLASRGKRVLIVERGPFFSDATVYQDERAMQIEQRAADNRVIDYGSIQGRAFTGGIAGGSTALYGACLMRPGPSDFAPGRHYGRFLPRDAWQWPIGYTQLAPYFSEAEAIYHVAGVHTQNTPHLFGRPTAYPQAPLALHPTNRMLMDHFHKAGLDPFQLPMGIDARRCDRCPTCPGYICHRDARASSLERCIKPAVAKHGAHFAVRTEVVNVSTRGRRVSSVTLRGPQGTSEIAADALILSAGAVGSPVFLIQHNLCGGNDLVGRYYMFHLGVIFSVVRLSPTGAGKTFIKQLGLTDFYLSGSAPGHKLGYIQQLPIPGPLTLADQLPVSLPAPFLKSVLTRNITFAGAIEDLPQPTNRVSLGATGIRIHHRYDPYDVYRARLLQRHFEPVMKRISTSMGTSLVAVKEKLHTAHQVGTCRFGLDPRSSVLDPDCRLHHMDNLYVVDGSFMPTSLGVAPALTIMANALRVANKFLIGS